MNIPNAITLSRLVLTGACVALLTLAGSGDDPSRSMVWVAFWLFLIAAITDFVDGWLARRYGQVTPFGRIADPFVDKVLICGVLIALLRFSSTQRYLSDWMVVLIVAREFLVTAVRGLAESQGMAFPADRLGKFKMVAQSCTAGALLTLLCDIELWRPVAAFGIWVTLALTLWSGTNYVWKARHLLRAS